ncbi:MAG TPA: DUF4331 family protein [Gemmatimonadaceae bacterium]|nr:DUF4331 family protein [Gemmatimonadaceae bacterium]
MQLHRKALLTISALALAFTTAACENDKRDDITGPLTTPAISGGGGAAANPGSDSVRFANRVFNQVERLGNPLVAEVFLEMKDHGFHDVGTPNTDRQNFRFNIVRFITDSAGRSPQLAAAIADVLLPDMITLQTDKAPGTAGYLGFVLNPNAYGGRRLQDDAVDISLAATFGRLLDPANIDQTGAKPGLATDNVPAFGGGPVPTNTFPYLAAPNQ